MGFNLECPQCRCVSFRSYWTSLSIYLDNFKPRNFAKPNSGWNLSKFFKNQVLPCFGTCSFKEPLRENLIEIRKAGPLPLLGAQKNDCPSRLPCPICDKIFDAAHIESHVGVCVQEAEFKKDDEDLENKKKRLKPLPKPIYHLLKDAQIRAKLKELQLPTHGHREVHTNYQWLYSNFFQVNHQKAFWICFIAQFTIGFGYTQGAFRIKTGITKAGKILAKLKFVYIRISKYFFTLLRP